MSRLRWRFARLLLGYRPIQIPEADGVYIVYRSDSTSMVVTTASIEMTIDNSMPLDPTPDQTGYGFARRRTGTFSGTL